MGALNRKRISGIELLKLIAMLLIVISHTGPYYGTTYLPSMLNLRLATTNFQYFLLSFHVYLGQIGNCIFLVCSAYFLLEQDKVKANKILHLLADSLFFSLAFLGIFLVSGQELPTFTIIKQFFPTTFEFCWFVGCYLLLYIIHPALNLIIRSTSQKNLFFINLAGILLYSILQMILRDSFYYTRFIGFILIYFLTAYSKLYLKNTAGRKGLNRIVLIASFFLLFAMVGLTNILGLYMETFCERVLHYCTFVNPFIILIAFSAFNLCKECKIESRFINIPASVTLYIYMIHENYLFATYVRPLCFEYIYQTYTYQHVALWAVLFAIVCYLTSLCIGLLYRYSLGIFIHKICDKLAEKLPLLADKCYAKLKKWN